MRDFLGFKYLKVGGDYCSAFSFSLTRQGTDLIGGPRHGLPVIGRPSYTQTLLSMIGGPGLACRGLYHFRCRGKLVQCPLESVMKTKAFGGVRRHRG